MPLTVKRLQAADWKQCYAYDYNDRGAGFKTFSCDLPNITITHDRKVGSQRTLIYYTVFRRKTDSPSQAVRMYNEAEKREKAKAR